MKKKLSYRDKLLELSKIYNVKEIQEYIKKGKNLTSGQIELILRKNKIVIPKDFNTNFFRENITKPLSRVTKQIDNLKEDSTKKVNKVSRRLSYFKEDSSRSILSSLRSMWNVIGNAGLGFLNIIPKLGKTYYSFFSQLFR